jgi:hypothetical protein
MSTETVFLSYSVEKLDQMCGHIEVCLASLSAEQAWRRGGENQNAIGNLVLHLAGNVRQWILSGVCGEPDHRHRDAEFAARDGAAPAELAKHLRSAVDAAIVRIGTLPHPVLLETMSVQGYEVTKLEGIYHVVEHFSGHAFQIIFITKTFSGADLGFYADIAQPKASGSLP